ncbi:MAG: c-type cytochrome, partial [Verrucomicrobia bacterium]|nr:c-type cytochrome [Verrucomicrobiota bacterium]
DYGGGLDRLIRAPSPDATAKFPTRLSETGIFVSTPKHLVEPGLIPYSVIAPAWADGASAQRYIGLPGEARIDYTSSGGWNFPNGTVLVQTLALERSAGDPASRRRIETRLLTRQQGQWVGYSYRWGDDQTDATLVGANGENLELEIQATGASGGRRRQTWRFPSRAECMACHSRAANFVLGLSELQMNTTHDYGRVRDNQLRTLQHLGLFTSPLPRPPADLAHLVNPYDATPDLQARARSYLHANCSVCHVGAGGGNSKLELAYSTPRDQMNLIEARPQHDTFGINNAMLVAPGDPERSILYQRLVRRGRGQMPPLVIATVDEQAVTLFRDWIRALPPLQHFIRDWKMDDLLPRLAEIQRGRSFEAGRQAFRQTGCSQCHRFAGDGGSVGPDLTGVGQRLSPRDILESILLPSKVIAEGYATTEIETRSGEFFSGRVEREDNRVVVLRPLSAFEPTVTIRKTDIRERTLSKISNMPAGIANTLRQDQILDLLAYLISDGDSNAAAFHLVRSIQPTRSTR